MKTIVKPFNHPSICDISRCKNRAKHSITKEDVSPREVFNICDECLCDIVESLPMRVIKKNQSYKELLERFMKLLEDSKRLKEETKNIESNALVIELRTEIGELRKTIEKMQKSKISTNEIVSDTVKSVKKAETPEEGGKARGKDKK